MTPPQTPPNTKTSIKTSIPPPPSAPTRGKMPFSLKTASQPTLSLNDRPISTYRPVHLTADPTYRPTHRLTQYTRVPPAAEKQRARHFGFDPNLPPHDDQKPTNLHTPHDKATYSTRDHRQCFHTARPAFFPRAAPCPPLAKLEKRIDRVRVGMGKSIQQHKSTHTSFLSPQVR